MPLKAVLGSVGGMAISDGPPNGATIHESERPTAAGADYAVINDKPVHSVAATLADHHITLYTNVKNDALVTARTLHASTKSAVQSRAEDLASLRRQQHDNQSAAAPKTRCSRGGAKGIC